MMMFSKKEEGKASRGPPRRKAPEDRGKAPRRRGPPRDKRGPSRGERRPPGKRPPDGERRRERPPKRGESPEERGPKAKKEYKFDRFEIEVGSPKVTGMEKGKEEKKEGKKEEQVVREIVRGSPGEVVMTMDPKAEARFSNIEKDVGKLEINVSSTNESMVSVLSDLQIIKEGYSRVDLIIKELEETRDSYVKVDKTMRELAALYDLISAQINPFIDMEGGGDSPEVFRWDGIEDNVEQVRQRIEGLPDELQGMGERFESEASAVKTRDVAIPPSRRQFYYEANVLKWVQFLTSKIRQDDIPNLLKYYREIDWINEDIEITTMNFLTGAKSEPNLEHMEGDIYISEDGAVIGQSDGWKLSIEDHSKSLEYIEEILKYYPPKE
jgi:archaellum component FlaC